MITGTLAGPSVRSTENEVMTQEPPQSWPPPDAGATPNPWADPHQGVSPAPPGHGVGWAVTGPACPTYVDPLTGAPIPGNPPPGSGPVSAGPAGTSPYQAGAYPAGPNGSYPAGAYPDTAYAPNPPAGYPPAGHPVPYSPYGWRAPVPTNGLAVASMVLGILWMFWIGSILAVVFGHVARGQIRRSGESGDGMAVAGIVLGWIGVGLLVLGIVGSVASGTS